MVLKLFKIFNNPESYRGGDQITCKATKSCAWPPQKCEICVTILYLTTVGHNSNGAELAQPDFAMLGTTCSPDGNDTSRGSTVLTAFVVLGLIITAVPRSCSAEEPGKARLTGGMPLQVTV